MGEQLDRIMDRAGQVADAAVKTTSELVAKGRDKAEEVALQAKLGKLHRQLGALVYALRKNGDENEPMVNWYVAEIDRVTNKIAQLQNGGSVRSFGSWEDDEDAMFRGGDGD